MGKPKISIASFVDGGKAQSDDDLFGGLDERFNESKEDRCVAPRKGSQAAKVSAELEQQQFQAREDSSRFNVSAVKDSDFYNPEHESNYDDLKEDYDAESLTGSQDESTLMSVDSRSTLEAMEAPEQAAMAMCSDDMDMGVKAIVALSQQTGASMVDLRTFLAQELEIDGLGKDMAALQEEVAKNSMESLHSIDLKELFTQFMASTRKAAEDKPLELGGETPVEETAMVAVVSDESSVKEKAPTGTTDGSPVKEKALEVSEQSLVVQGPFADGIGDENMEEPSAATLEPTSTLKTKVFPFPLSAPSMPATTTTDTPQTNSPTPVTPPRTATKPIEPTGSPPPKTEPVLPPDPPTEPMLSDPCRNSTLESCFGILPIEEEGTEMMLNDEPPKAKKSKAIMKPPTFLSKMFTGTGSSKDDFKLADQGDFFDEFMTTDDIFFDDATVGSMSLSATLPNIMRMQMDDGDMVSVSKETAAKLQNCEWV